MYKSMIQSLNNKASGNVSLERLTKFVCMPIFLKETAQHFIKFPLPDTQEEFVGITAHKIKDQIFSYKKKVAQKNKKAINTQGAFLDITDCIKQAHEQNLQGGCYTAVVNQKDCVYTLMKHYGNICLPFKNCYIYLNQNDSSYVLEILDNEDGTYKGKLYCSLPFKSFIQLSFVIRREEDYWSCICELNKNLRPFGQIMSNNSCVIHALMCVKEEHTKDLVDEQDQELYANFVKYQFAMKVFEILKQISSYKNKQLYKVGNDMFVYSQRNTILEYINKMYPNQHIEKQEGWLVNGYWKIIPESEYGKDRKGNKIKGLDWIVPYEQEEKQEITTNNQTTNLVKLHALRRAKERYDIDLTMEDLQNIVDLCINNKAKTLFITNKFGQLKCAVKPNKAGCYRVWYNHMYLDVALEYDSNIKKHRVSTFLPKPTDIQCTTITSKAYLEVTKWKSQ